MPRDPRHPLRARPTLTVEASATIDGQPVFLNVGLGRILHTPAGKKLRMTLGAVPDEREIYVSITDVLRLDALDDQPEAHAPDRPGHVTH